MRASFVSFVGVFLTLMGLFYAYMGKRLFSFGWPQNRTTGWLFLALPLVLMVLMPVLFYLRHRNPHHETPDWVFWVVYLSMSFMSVLLTVIVVRDLALLAGRLTARFVPAASPWASGLESAGVSQALILAAIALTLWGLFQANRTPRIHRVDVSVPGLAAPFDGYKVALISDLHIGPTIKRGFVERVVREVNGLDADLSVLPGDVADGVPSDLTLDTAPLAEVRAKDGLLYATGNHEYYWNAQAWVVEMARLGWKPLLNSNVVLEKGGAKLIVAGVTDPTAFRVQPDQAPNFRKALEGAPEGAPALWLAHQPTAAIEAEPIRGGLMLSGHTHGGQWFPWSLVIHLVQPYVKGLYRRGNLALYVTPGTGYWGPPNRWGVPSEVTLLVLHPEK